MALLGAHKDRKSRRLILLGGLLVLHDVLLVPLYPGFKTIQIWQLFPEWFWIQFAAFHSSQTPSLSTHCDCNLLRQNLKSGEREFLSLWPLPIPCLWDDTVLSLLPWLLLSIGSSASSHSYSTWSLPFTQLQLLLSGCLSPLKDCEPQEGMNYLIT